MWTPVDSSGFQWPSCQAKLAGGMPSPVQSSPVHWTETGLQATFQSPVEVQWTESPVRVQWSPLDYRLNYNKHYNNISSPVESTGLDWTGLDGTLILCL
jgi:hypothetical protein